jgi:hypothetical protein
MLLALSSIPAEYEAECESNMQRLAIKLLGYFRARRKLMAEAYKELFPGTVSTRIPILALPIYVLEIKKRTLCQIHLIRLQAPPILQAGKEQRRNP